MKYIGTAILLGSFLANAADDPWAKVKELKSGTELRIFKKAANPPIAAAMDEATEERIVVVVKNEQVSIPKDEIDRIDYRPKGGSRMIKESKITTAGPGNPTPAQQRVGGGPPGPSQSSSGGLSFGSKPGFETIYRRMLAAPAK